MIWYFYCPFKPTFFKDGHTVVQGIHTGLSFSELNPLAIGSFATVAADCCVSSCLTHQNHQHHRTHHLRNCLGLHFFASTVGQLANAIGFYTTDHFKCPTEVSSRAVSVSVCVRPWKWPNTWECSMKNRQQGIVEYLQRKVKYSSTCLFKLTGILRNRT